MLGAPGDSSLRLPILLDGDRRNHDRLAWVGPEKRAARKGGVVGLLAPSATRRVGQWPDVPSPPTDARGVFPSMSSVPPRHVVVVGSINMDLVARVARLPRPGETLHGDQFLQCPGGKGANQAVAVARLGGRCSMVARVGDDVFGAELLGNLARSGVETRHIEPLAGCSSGVALIGVDAAGQNAITIVAGANGRLTPEDIERQAELIAGADALLVQLEVPMSTVEAALAIAQRRGVRSVLDPAPAPESPLPPSCLNVDVISPNQSEAEVLTGVAVRDPSSAHEAARRLRDLGAERVALKLGDQGAFWCDAETAIHVPTARVPVVDTTAAGDAFTAALTIALAEGREPASAVRFACAAGTLAATRLGAQPSMPTRLEVESFLESLP